MNRAAYFLLTLALFLSIESCKKKEGTHEIPEYVTSPDQIPTLKSGVRMVDLNADAQKMVAEWPEYQSLNELILRYQEISKNEALLNSAELEELSRYLKDSIRVEKLDIPSVRMRLNVLHNEAMRMYDMSAITSIKDEEVLEETDKLLSAYAALNIKINDMSRQEKINRELERFNELEAEESDSIEEITTPEKKTSRPAIKKSSDAD